MIYYAPLVVTYDLLADGYYLFKKNDLSRLKAKFSALKQLPRVLKERDKNQSTRKISSVEMDKLWGPYYSPWFIYQRRRRLNRILQKKTS